MYFWRKNRYEQLQQDGERLLREEMAKQKMTGICAGICQHGEPLAAWVMGDADRERQIPMQQDTLFRIFSMTKPVTAVAVMQLWEHGRLDLWDELYWYYPEYKHKQVAYGGRLVPSDRPVRLYDLMNMTAGFPYPGNGDVSEIRMAALFDEMGQREKTASPIDTQTLCRRIGQDVPLAFQPGTQWAYGTSADILGAVIELVSDMPLDEYFRQNIFEPLGMTDTDFYVPPEKWHRFSQLYMWHGDLKQLLIEPDPHLGLSDYRKKPAYLSGGAGLISTLPDYQAFANMLACGGEDRKRGVRLLSENTCRYLCSPQLNEMQKRTLSWDSLRGHSYGNLMRVLENPAEFATNAPLGEVGWDGWTGPYFAVSQQLETSFVYLIQNCGAGMSDCLRKLRAMCYGAINQ